MPNDVSKLFTSDPAVSVLVSVFADLEDKLGHKFFTSDRAEKFGLYAQWVSPCVCAVFLHILMFASFVS